MAAVDTSNVGFLLATASHRWNELLYERFRREEFAEVRPAYGSILLPLFEDDGLRMGELAARARLAKQTMTTMVRLLERDGLVERRPDSADRRAARVFLTARARAFRPVAARALAELQILLDARLGAGERRSLERALKEVIDL
jgi:DNA-binding MarR family transcriptional regulator